MRKYVNETTAGPIGASAKEKCDAILADGGKEIPTPKTFMEGLVCVVDNGRFGAAGYAYCEEEMKAFQVPTDFRNKRWFVWGNVTEFAE